jgi:hypothetical protein
MLGDSWINDITIRERIELFRSGLKNHFEQPRVIYLVSLVPIYRYYLLGKEQNLRGKYHQPYKELCSDYFKE